MRSLRDFALTSSPHVGLEVGVDLVELESTDETSMIA